MPKNQQLKDLFSFLKPINPKLEKYNDYNEFRQSEFRINIENGSEECKKRHEEFLNSLLAEDRKQYKELFEN